MTKEQPPKEEICASMAQSTEESGRLEALNKFEESVSTKAFEQIMGKVQDLSQSGIAYSRIRRLFDRDAESLKSKISAIDPDGKMPPREFEPKKNELVNGQILPAQLNESLGEISRSLKQGILGVRPEESGVYEHPDSAQEYREDLREQRSEDFHRLVHFNITGRSFLGKSQPNKTGELLELGRTLWSGQADAMSIVFDASDLTETYPGEGKFNLGRREASPNTFTVANKAYSTLGEEQAREVGVARVVPGNPGEPVKESQSGEIIVDDEYGFITGKRISPRKFQGIVISAVKEKGLDETTYYSQEELLRLARNVAATLIGVNEEKPERIVPIYDTFGNLIWPQQMSYEDVRALTAQN